MVRTDLTAGTRDIGDRDHKVPDIFRSLCENKASVFAGKRALAERWVALRVCVESLLADKLDSVSPHMLFALSRDRLSHSHASSAASPGAMLIPSLAAQTGTAEEKRDDVWASNVRAGNGRDAMDNTSGTWRPA